MNDERREEKETLDERIGRLPAEIEPPPELWSRIVADIEAPTARVERTSAQLPIAVEPPEFLWRRIRAEIELGPPSARRDLRPFPLLDIAASIAITSILAIVAFYALTLDRTQLGSLGMPDFQARGGDISVWPAQFASNDIESNEPGYDAYWLGLNAAIRKDFETVRSERLAIEASMQTDYENAELRELWQHAYHTELRLIDEAGKLLETFEGGWGT